MTPSTARTPASSPRLGRRGRVHLDPPRQHPPAVRARRAVRRGRLRRLHRRSGLAARVLPEGLHPRPLRPPRRRRQERLLGDRARDGDLRRRARRAAGHGAQLRALLPHRPVREGRARRPAGELGRVPRLRPQDHRPAGRRLGHAGGVQAGHRGVDPAALALPAGRRRPARRRRQADDQLRCRPRGARVHDRRSCSRTRRRPEGVLELPDMQGLWLEGKLAMAPVWPYLYSLSKEPLGGRYAIATMPGLVRPGGTVYSWGFAAASGAKNPEGADEFIKLGHHHRPPLRLRQGMAEPGAARLGDRAHLRGPRHRRRTTRPPSPPSPPPRRRARA